MPPGPPADTLQYSPFRASLAATMPTPTLESAAAALKAASDVSVLPPGVVRPISLAERTIEAKIERLRQAPPLRPMRQAPQKPTPEEIYDWNLPWINFDWKTVEWPEECEEC